LSPKVSPEKPLDMNMYYLCTSVWDIRKEKESEKAKMNYYSTSTSEEDRIAFNLSWAKGELAKATGHGKFRE
jgi:hypothetical protein